MVTTPEERAEPISIASVNVPSEAPDTTPEPESDTDGWISFGDDTTGKISEQETEVTAELPASTHLEPRTPPLKPPPVEVESQESPEPSHKIRRPTDPEPDPLSPAEPLHHRHAHATLRNIRAAATTEATPNLTEDPWAESKKRRNITALAALSQHGNHFRRCGGIYWSIGSLFQAEDLPNESDSLSSSEQKAGGSDIGPQPLRRAPMSKRTIQQEQEAGVGIHSSPPSPMSTASDTKRPVEQLADDTPSNEAERVAENRPAETRAFASSTPASAANRRETNRINIPKEREETGNAYIQEAPPDPPATMYTPISNDGAVTRNEHSKVG